MDRRATGLSLKDQAQIGVTDQSLRAKGRAPTFPFVTESPVLNQLQTGFPPTPISKSLGQQGLSPTAHSPVQMKQLASGLSPISAPISQAAQENTWNNIQAPTIIGLDDVVCADQTEASYLEIFHYPTAESRTYKGALDDNNYDDWLDRDFVLNNGETPISGCRLVLIRRPKYGLAALFPVMLRRDHLRKTVEKWDLDETFPEQMVLWTSLTKNQKLPGKSYKFISRLINGTDQGSSISVISFDSVTNMTFGIVIGLYSDEQIIENDAVDNGVWENHMFHQRIFSSIDWTWHPVANVIVQVDESLRFFQLIARIASIRVVELSHSAGIMQLTTSNEMVPLAEVLARDYTTDTASLAIQSAQAALCQTALESNLSILEELAQTIDAIEAVSPRMKEIRPYLLTEINNLKSRCKSSVGYTQGIQRNISYTQTAIYNLLAQRDSKLNLELARDSRMLAIASKRDSSSMKTIAVLTIAFLPGTFVSSLFAMPVLNWEAKSYGDVMTEKFWVYWAVTIPMTALIILAWVAWVKRQSWLKSKDRQEGMKTFNEVDVEKFGAMQGETVPLMGADNVTKAETGWRKWFHLRTGKNNKNYL
ncbi:hypothetical protein H072_10093 [Dactylellina haptotyla CBS 200.50]|uniref:Uncharacterized protein n=1 Tax=Dactylellina haptotyla (strain CBS 200.50) TaxID=1284197 RepID=S8A0A0_DACHA|nr:hypothetical protein H072_10093 [Dactylellina haptotyla CBS 200.50]